MMNKYFEQIGIIKVITKNLSENFLQVTNRKKKVNIDNYSKIKSEVRKNIFEKYIFKFFLWS